MTSQWKYRISVRAVILSLSSYFVFPFVKPGDRLKFGGRVWVFGTGRPFSGRVHDVLQLVLGWSGQAFYNFRIHGQEIGRRRHLRTHRLREFQLRRREKVLYTYDFLDLREWEMRVLDIEPGSAEAWRPRCLAGCAATPSMRLQRTAPARQLRKTRCIFCSRLSVAFARKRERIFVQREEDHIRTY